MEAGNVAQWVPAQQVGGPEFDIQKEQIQKILNNFTRVACVTVHVWESEGNLQGSVLSSWGWI